MANDYHEGSRATGHVLSAIRSGNLPPRPAAKIRTDFLQVKHWTKGEYNACSKIQRGRTEGDATTTRVKGKRGRPTKNTDGDNERPRHPYLVNADGVPVSEEQVAEMSRKARMLWRTLDADGMAPLTFGQISYKAWEYYSSIMLADKLFNFLLLCDDGEWKLREWSSKSYPSWHRHRFNKDPNDDQVKGMSNILTTASISHYHCIDSSPDPAQTSTGARAREQHAENRGEEAAGNGNDGDSGGEAGEHDETSRYNDTEHGPEGSDLDARGMLPPGTSVRDSLSMYTLYVTRV